MILNTITSECGKYQYLVSSKREGTGQPLAFVLDQPRGVTPEKDQDIARCLYLAKRCGYGGVLVTYLFALKMAFVRDAKSIQEVVGERTDEVVKKVASAAPKVVFAWGDAADTMRTMEVIRIVSDVGHAVPQCFGLTPQERPKAPPQFSRTHSMWPYPPQFLYTPDSDEYFVTDNRGRRELVRTRQAEVIRYAEFMENVEEE